MPGGNGWRRMWGGGWIFQKTVFLESVQDNEDTRNRGPSIQCAEMVKQGVGTMVKWMPEGQC